MVFGKIEYINLLPFHVFMKRFTKGSSAKMSMEYKKSVPSKINSAFHARRIDAAFISSISAKKSQYIGLGIIAKKDVKSVLVIPDKKTLPDVESATSNILAKVLNAKGEILIGDKALRYALANDNYVDLAKKWNEKYNLPFVFALLCFHKDKKLYKKIENEFLKKEIKIPKYILEKASKRTNIKEQDIIQYLNLISYNLDYKAKLGLKLFYKASKSIF